MRDICRLSICLASSLVLFCGCSGNSNSINAPTALNYSTMTAVYTKGVAIALNSPTVVGGAASSYSVSPALPAGLSLNSTTGVVSGTPTAVTATAIYSATASNSKGSVTAALTITVNDQPPSALQYTSTTPIYAIRIPITPNTPTNAGGTVASYSVSPALPLGLSLNGTTGVISGTPTKATAEANYTVTASNTQGNATAVLSITTAKIVPSGPAMACANVLQLVIPNTQITKAELVSANSTNSTTYPTWGFMPEHCLVQGIVNPRLGVPAPAMDQYGNLTPAVASDPNYGISFELRMPTTTWNGDFFFTGGSGNDGVVAEAVGATLGGGAAYAPALYRGFAVITQNSGHTALENQLGTALDQAGNQNNGFGYDPEARYDYGYQQTGSIAPMAKSILGAFYGTGPVYSYFLGCSNGGREAMVASQRWGDMFDGIVAGDPGYRLPHAAIAEAWDTQQLAAAAEAVDAGNDPLDGNGKPGLTDAASASDLALVAALVTKSCDALDGVEDGMIFNTAACQQTFDPATLSQLECSGAKAPSCLLAQQIAAIQNVFKGPVDSQGHALYSAWPYDAGIGDPKWMMWTVGATLYEPDIPVGIPYIAQNTTQGATSAKYLFTTPPDPSLDIFTVSMDDLSAGIVATNSTFTQSAVQYMEATSPNLDVFKGRDGKIIYFHGESDPVFSMYDSVNYYEKLSTRYGAGTADFARLFLIPGMNHCAGGLHTLDSFDPLTAIVNWVEVGATPDSMTAANSNPANPPTAPPVYSYLQLTWKRPLCPYPQFAQYTGTGSLDDASSFRCAVPAASGGKLPVPGGTGSHN